MTKATPRTLPILTGTPLDYVPIDAPLHKTTPTRYRINPMKRGCAAASWFISAAAFLFIVAVVTGLI
jgi:hypothetical protein